MTLFSEWQVQKCYCQYKFSEIGDREYEMSREKIFERHLSTQVHAQFTPETVNEDQIISMFKFLIDIVVMRLCILFRRIQLLNNV
jgi:hypothetical protein